MSNHIQALRDEIQNAPLTADKKAEAVELIDEVETHCIRKPKRVS